MYTRKAGFLGRPATDHLPRALERCTVTNPNIDPIEWAEFWRFWKWQYTCRNTEYIKAFKKYDKLGHQISALAEKRTVTEKDLAEFNALCDSCQKKYGWTPSKNPNQDSDSQKILVDLYTHIKTSKKIVNKKIVNFCPYKHEKVDIWGLENGNIRYTIDFNKPLEQVLSEVKNIYRSFEINRKAVSEKKMPSPIEIDEIRAEIDGYFLNSSDEGFLTDDENRAIGLWLRDYVKRHNIKVRAAIRELDKIIDFDESGFGSLEKKTTSNKNVESTYKRITRYYNLAVRCIEEMKILPISS